MGLEEGEEVALSIYDGPSMDLEGLQGMDLARQAAHAMSPYRPSTRNLVPHSLPACALQCDLKPMSSQSRCSSAPQDSCSQQTTLQTSTLSL